MPKRTSKYTDFTALYCGDYRYEFYGVSKICFSILRIDFNSCFPQDYKSSGAGVNGVFTLYKSIIIGRRLDDVDPNKQPAVIETKKQ